jgi:hypothetical protein
MGIADWHMCLPLNQGFGDYWLAQGDLPQARRMATKLCASAALPPERTYLAFGHRLLAEIGIVERQWDKAEEELAQAMSTMNGPPTPSAVWQAYGIAPPECSVSLSMKSCCRGSKLPRKVALRNRSSSADPTGVSKVMAGSRAGRRQRTPGPLFPRPARSARNRAARTARRGTRQRCRDRSRRSTSLSDPLASKPACHLVLD